MLTNVQDTSIIVFYIIIIIIIIIIVVVVVVISYVPFAQTPSLYITSLIIIGKLFLWKYFL